MAEPSTRAKWRALRSARVSTLKKCLTPPTLSETPVFASHALGLKCDAPRELLMFERYTEKARRVIFFGRYEASQYGSPYIETEHLLLGLLREDAALTRMIFGSGGAIKKFISSASSIESIRRKISERGALGKKISTAVDLPLSNECKRVLAYAAEVPERLASKRIGTEHRLPGL